MEQKKRSTYQRGTFFFSVITFSSSSTIIIVVIIIIIFFFFFFNFLFRVLAKVAGAILESALVSSMAIIFASLAKQSPVSRPFGYVAEY